MNRLRRGASDDAGVALVFVVGTTMILAMLAMTALAYVTQSTMLARYDQDHSSAMSAAQAGVDDFIAHLNRNDGYWNTAAKPYDFCSNAAAKGPILAGGSNCGWNATTVNGWLPVKPGVTGPKAPYFHYSWDFSQTVIGGPVVLTVTGRANGEYRTVEATVGKGSSTDYVYYTDRESADPANLVSYPGGSVPTACGGAGYTPAKYWYETRSGCTEIQFTTGDVLNGPVFSNDSIRSVGGSFKSTFFTADPSCKAATTDPTTWKKCVRDGSGNVGGTATFGKQPAYADTQYLDDTSAQFATFPGCHYYGSTRIVFKSDGTMTVWNNTKNGGGRTPDGKAAPGDVGVPACGTFPALSSAAGATVPVPTDKVIYVSGDTTGLARAQCDAGQLGGPTGSTLPLGTYTKAIATAKPATTSSSYDYDKSMAASPMYCQEGNVYVEGVVKGRVSIAAEQSVVVTGDIVLAGGLNGTDMFGLVATNSVQIYHPWKVVVPATGTGCPSSSSCKWGTAADAASASQYTNTPTQYNDPTGVTVVNGVNVMGSIQTLQHSFYVQQYDKGSGLGTLQVNGSIAQRWRGAVGTAGGGTGYIKNYVYDKRLIYSAPPYFPHWVQAQWKQRYFGEVDTPATLRQ